MSKRHEAIGIKQVIRFEWMQKTVNLLLAGLDATAIRQELHEFLADRKGSGSEGDRSIETRNFVVGNLMKIWVCPDEELIPFRDASLAVFKKNPSMELAVNWGLISAVYPFWFHVARQSGRLLSLQDQINRTQIISRLKEQYGDRQTVSRYAQYVIRSFVAWGVLKESEAKGCYEKPLPIVIPDQVVASLMLEAGLHAKHEGKETLTSLLNNPAFFPFHFPALTGAIVAQRAPNIELIRYGLDDELMKLKNTSASLLTL
jgi:hypothetical protein